VKVVLHYAAGPALAARLATLPGIDLTICPESDDAGFFAATAAPVTASADTISTTRTLFFMVALKFSFIASSFPSRDQSAFAARASRELRRQVQCEKHYARLASHRGRLRQRLSGKQFARNQPRTHLPLRAHTGAGSY